MKSKKAVRSALGMSVLSIALCAAMLIGTTFAWFTDTASTAVNKIQAGTLKVDIVGKEGSLDGKNMSLLTEEELVKYKRDVVGFVWQNNSRNLFPYLDALDNVVTPMLFRKGNKAQKRERAEELLELVGMADRKNSTLRQLSGGEQQRVAIAIALANNPKLLLADEPTGAVDVKTANQIFELFRKLNEEMGLTVVIVTHDNKIAKMVQRVVRIQDGKISSEQIMKDEYESSLRKLSFGELDLSEKTHEEFSILDKFGRVQLPEKMMEQAGIEGKKVRLEVVEGNIVVKKE